NPRGARRFGGWRTLRDVAGNTALYSRIESGDRGDRNGQHADHVRLAMDWATGSLFEIHPLAAGRAACRDSHGHRLRPASRALVYAPGTSIPTWLAIPGGNARPRLWNV